MSIRPLVSKFRKALEVVHEKGFFDHDVVFQNFPIACCGNASDLLAEYLADNGFSTVYVCGDCEGQTHAWLILKDEHIHGPQSYIWDISEEVRNALISYTGGEYVNQIETAYYQYDDLKEGLIIDITADQFGETPIYIGYSNSFYKKFEFEIAYDYKGLDSRLMRLYKLIISYIE